MKHKTVIDLFQSVSKRYPKITSLIFNDQVMNYSELEDLSNIIASNLIKAGVKNGDILP